MQNEPSNGGDGVENETVLTSVIELSDPLAKDFAISVTDKDILPLQIIQDAWRKAGPGGIALISHFFIIFFAPFFAPSHT